MAIKPIDLPAAAGIDYSGGDVRHFAQGDAVNVPGLSNPTRNLAERDNLLATKLNEIAGVVNNQEQFVPLPVIRTTVPPSEEIIVTNYRIPSGFEARVLNAVISTTPASTNAQLNVQYSTSYGGVSGAVVVTVTPGSEFTGDVNFYQTGEFIVSLKNTGAATLELAASIMLTMRPLGAEGTLLVGSIIAGPEGKPGMTGPPGPPGVPGTGGAGSPGMQWRNNWAVGVYYNTNDTVAYNYSGTYGSWICRTPHTAILGVNDPQTDTTTWNTVAIGILGATGAVGPVGPAGGVPTYTDTLVQAKLVTAASYVPGVWNADYTSAAVVTPSTVYAMTLRETTISNATGTPRGLAYLEGLVKTCYNGSASIILPSIALGATVDYTTSYIKCIATANGTVGYYDGTVPTVRVTDWGNGWGIKIEQQDNPIPVAIALYGVQSF